MREALLRDSDAGVVINQAITGMGGLGKTQLAVEFAYRYGRFFRGVHWLDLADPSLLDSEIAQCGMQMSLPNFPADQPSQVVLTINTWKEDGPRLLVLDNFEAVDQVNKVLSRLRHSNLRLLVTSRRTDWTPASGLQPLPLELFAPEESLDFLKKALDDRKEHDLEADLKFLAERLGHLPLALELASRYLNGHPRLKIPEYLTQLRSALEHPSMQDWRNDLHAPTEHDLHLLNTFAISWNTVKNEAAQKVFLTAGYLAPNSPIPFEIFEESCEIDSNTCDEALDTLYGLGLLRKSDNNLPLIHPLLAEYARGLSKDDIKVLESLADTLGTLSKDANQTGLPSSFVPIRPHMPVTATFCEKINRQVAALLWNEYGLYLQSAIADLVGAKTALEISIKLYESELGSDHDNVAALINNLGAVLKDLGDLAGAKTSYERAIKIWEANLGSEHPQVAIGVNNLGLVLKALGDLAGAKAAVERALKIDEATYGSDNPKVAIRVNNLGSVLHDLGNLLEAKAAYERALRIDEATYGLDHPDIAIDVNNLGSVLQDLGDLHAAKASYERALKIDEASFGPDHPNVAIRVNNLGLVLKALGDLAGAKAAVERALKIDEATYGSDNPKVAIRINNLGSVLKALGDLPGAKAAYERALALFKKFLPPDHPNIKTVQGNLDSLK